MGNNSCMLLLGILQSKRLLYYCLQRLFNLFDGPWEKEKKSAVQPEKKRERESSLVPIISEQEVSGSFRLELT